MKFSTRARYGMRALLDIALNGDDGLVMLKDIAVRQEISKRYLEHMMTLLKKGGLVVSERGVQGRPHTQTVLAPGLYPHRLVVLPPYQGTAFQIATHLVAPFFQLHNKRCYHQPDVPNT